MYCAISYCPVSIMIGEPLGNDSDFLSVKVYLRYSKKQDKHMRMWGLSLIFIRFNGIYNISVNFWMFEHISVDVLDPCFSLSWANMSGIFCLSDYSLLEPCCRISDIVSPELRKITISLLKSTWALKENIKYTTRRNKSLVMWCSSPGQLIWFHAAVKKWKSPSTWI